MALRQRAVLAVLPQVLRALGTVDAVMTLLETLRAIPINTSTWGMTDDIAAAVRTVEKLEALAETWETFAKPHAISSLMKPHEVLKETAAELRALLNGDAS